MSERLIKILVATAVLVFIGVIFFDLHLIFWPEKYLIKKSVDKCVIAHLARADVTQCQRGDKSYKDGCDLALAIAIEKEADCETAEAYLHAHDLRKHYYSAQ
ncbi:hypothetical protein A7976_13575 [Methylobacillus sp. MM3]|uniref:hypothetical protein n=1 Tax=Methylobacillus sp. MM3 TaxID=1848039 RepID=UPI0007DE90F4|nr:hypothetical protein [Methylobacillus sp. MM3]OAJ69658.1 hypothetical protein A7976_13575 [Methylobacillus sp. MM3]